MDYFQVPQINQIQKQLINDSVSNEPQPIDEINAKQTKLNSDYENVNLDYDDYYYVDEYLSINSDLTHNTSQLKKGNIFFQI